MLNKKNKNSLSIQVIFGFVFCLLYLFVKYPFSLFSLQYVTLLLLVAVLILVPIGLELLGIRQAVKKRILVASISFWAAFLLEESIVSTLLILPWLTFVSYVGIWQSKQFLQKRKKRISAYCFLAACLYMPVAAIWAMFDRMDIQPMGFSPTIVLLTAVHFHYAGFLLPLISGMILKKENKKIFQLIAWGVILGIPLVAVGIISEQYHLPHFIEITAVCLMTFSAASIGFLQVQKGIRIYKKPTGVFFLLGGLALVGGMTLAFFYGIRSLVPIPLLTIPWMYVVHGTLNAVGFALPSLFAWLTYNSPVAV